MSRKALAPLLGAAKAVKAGNNPPNPTMTTMSTVNPVASLRIGSDPVTPGTAKTKIPKAQLPKARPSTSVRSRDRARGAFTPHFHGEEARVCVAYTQLNSEARQEVMDLLLEHTFLLNGRNSYVYWARWNEVERRTSYLLLLAHASEQMADAWFDWAFAISSWPMSALSRRNAILSLVDKLVVLKLLEKPLPLRVTASRKKHSIPARGRLGRHK